MPRRSTVMRELPAVDDATARMLELHAREPERYPAYLDSAATGGPLGRFSLLMAAPGARLVLSRDNGLAGPGSGDTFCERLNRWWRDECGSAPRFAVPWTRSWISTLSF